MLGNGLDKNLPYFFRHLIGLDFFQLSYKSFMALAGTVRSNGDLFYYPGNERKIIR